jgi:hypothetical protein
MSREKISTKSIADATSPADQVFLITRVPMALHMQVKRHACDNRTTIQRVVADAIQAALGVSDPAERG